MVPDIGKGSIQSPSSTIMYTSCPHALSRSSVEPLPYLRPIARARRASKYVTTTIFTWNTMRLIKLKLTTEKYQRVT